MVFLRLVDIAPPRDRRAFPFTLPAVRYWRPLELGTPVAFLAGENGSGKSTLIEALAIAAGVPSIGSTDAGEDPSLKTSRHLASRMALTWNRRTHHGFFLRAEDVFGFIRRLASMKSEFQQALQTIEEDFRNSSEYARVLARGPIQSSLAGLERRYGDLNAVSHGEGFLHLFKARITAPGLYILDEPEAPLSAQNQLALIALIKEAVDSGSQFIVATHSPILLAFPGATIYSIDSAPISRVSLNDLPQFRLVRDFMNQPAAFLHHLFGDQEEQ